MLNELNTYTLQELYKQPIEPIPWVVEDLLAPGLYFLGGSPKVGKSCSSAWPSAVESPFWGSRPSGTKFFTSLWRTALGGCISAHCD